MCTEQNERSNIQTIYVAQQLVLDGIKWMVTLHKSTQAIPSAVHTLFPVNSSHYIVQTNQFKWAFKSDHSQTCKITLTFCTGSSMSVTIKMILGCSTRETIEQTHVKVNNYSALLCVRCFQYTTNPTSLPLLSQFALIDRHTSTQYCFKLKPARQRAQFES